MCIFANVEPEVVADLINESVGMDISVVEMMKIGERGWNLKRVINHRLGLTRDNDKLPKGLLEPYEDDPSGYVPDFQSMLEAYYNTRSWDPVNGFPEGEKLAELDLDWVIEDLNLIKAELTI
jgi:aldehyde:ferredoxin oxidoreductase